MCPGGAWSAPCITGISLVNKCCIDYSSLMGTVSCWIPVTLSALLSFLLIQVHIWSTCGCLPSLGQSISTLALDCLLLIESHSTVTVYSHGYWSLAMHQTRVDMEGVDDSRTSGPCDFWDTPFRFRGGPESILVWACIWGSPSQCWNA